MLEAAKTILQFTQGVGRDECRANLMLRHAVEQELGIIGEAARRVSESFRSAHPEIAWRGIVGQRNVLSHDYDEIDDARIWRVAVQDVPRLVEQLAPLVPPAPEETSG